MDDSYCSGTCLDCPHVVVNGKLFLRACSLSPVNDMNPLDFIDGVFVECRLRPELGMFEPTIMIEDCPVFIKNSGGLHLVKYIDSG